MPTRRRAVRPEPEVARLRTRRVRGKAVSCHRNDRPQRATRVSDRTAFFSVLTDSKSDTRTGVLVEYGPTEKIFHNPTDGRTEAYVTGRVG